MPSRILYVAQIPECANSDKALAKKKITPTPILTLRTILDIEGNLACRKSYVNQQREEPITHMLRNQPRLYLTLVGIVYHFGTNDCTTMQNFM
jgi:hypothetical protein